MVALGAAVCAAVWWAAGDSPSSFAAPRPEGPARVRWEPVAHGFDEITDIQPVPARNGLVIVLEKGGRARLLNLRRSGQSASSAPVVFEVEVRTRVELGLLGLAFHPDYARNGRFFVNDNPDAGPMRTRVSEWKLPAEELGKRRARLSHVVLEVEQPFSNHNGGQLVFGPDGKLYIGLGDGGAANDPHDHGQNLGSWLGSMLRIDVTGADVSRPYRVPQDNPFVKRAGARPEIWAYGFRNPWRYSFDPEGRLIVADVGQNLYEEVDIVERGANLGWNTREAAHCFSPPTGCPTGGLVDPVVEYGRDQGASITGGYVYAGKRIPWLRGRYVYADFVSGNVWAVRLPSNARGTAKAELLGTWPIAISSFARDDRGEIYAADFRSGTVLALMPAGK
jgi:glucose/arabinose dehydrogenase